MESQADKLELGRHQNVSAQPDMESQADKLDPARRQ